MANQSPSSSSPSTLWLPHLRTDQQQIVERLAQRQTVVLAMGRRWGKTVLGGVLSLASAANGGRIAWVVPSYKNGRPLWRWAEQLVRPLAARGEAVINKSERTIEFPSVGGFVGIYSTDDQGDALRGESFHLVIVDEAAKVPEQAWTDAIQPTLADFGGRALLISTPRGRNWFWREWMRGQEHTTQQLVWSATAPTSANPNPQIQRAAMLARDRVSERTYRQEWLAEFVDDAGGVFRNVQSCVNGQLLSGPQHVSERYVMGVDLAKYQDYTVCCVMDMRNNALVAFDRFNGADWVLQKARIKALAEHWNNALTYLDATGLGDPIYDDLRHSGMRVEPYKLTSATKTALIDNAVLLVEQRQVSYPALPVLLNELEAYEYDRTAAGTLRMNAPDGMHDDCVIAFALACWPLAQRTGGHIPSELLEAMRTPAPQRTGMGGATLLKRSF